MDIEYLIRNNCFQQNKPMSESSFRTYCKDRGFPVRWASDLEKFEEDGLLKPVFIIKRPIIWMKEVLRENGSKGLQYIDNQKNFLGPKHKKYEGIVISPDTFKVYLKDKCIENPAESTYRPWKEFRDPETREETVCRLYLSFQVIMVHEIVGYWPDKAALTKRLKELEKFIFLLTLIQNQYIPHTRSDGHIYQLRENVEEWRNWKRVFKPEEALERSGCSIEEVRKWWDTFSHWAYDIDPLKKWKHFIDYISYSKKQKLRGTALLAQDYYQVTKILKLFLNDLTDENLVEPDEQGIIQNWKKDIYGESALENRFEMLNYLCSEYGIHPTPKLVIFIEDKGVVENFIPVICRTLGWDFGNLGIEVRCLENAGEFQSKKLFRITELLLEKWIGVCLFVDNENNAKQNIEKLIKDLDKQSNTFRKYKDYLFKSVIFEKNFEFDNFTDEEIASCLTSQAPNNISFSIGDIQYVRENFPKKKLENIFSDNPATGSLSKTELAKDLAEVLVKRLEKGNDISGVPIIKKLHGLVENSIKYNKPIGSTGVISSWFK